MKILPRTRAEYPQDSNTKLRIKKAFMQKNIEPDKQNLTVPCKNITAKLKNEG